MRRILSVAALAVLLAMVAVLLVGCESPAAQRELAQAERIRAEGQAYERERAANDGR